MGSYLDMAREAVTRFDEGLRGLFAEYDRRLARARRGEAYIRAASPDEQTRCLPTFEVILEDIARVAGELQALGYELTESEFLNGFGSEASRA